MSDRRPQDLPSALNYKSAGVDVEQGDALVDWLTESESNAVRKDPRVISGIGGFAAIFRPDFQGYADPCLVAATDGIGTKVLLGAKFDALEVVAQDLVAMCVNDLICTGATPLFFLDYYATGKLVKADAQKFLVGVRRACQDSGCVLIGGETAEMPGLYTPPDIDAAGFAIGMVDRPQILGPDRVRAGDLVYGIPSNGFHSNGYSLLRKVFAAEIEHADTNVLKWLLKPTALYPAFVQGLKDHWKKTGGSTSEFPVHAIAHITGGGLENIPRVLPKNHEVELFDWAWPEEFLEVQDRTGMSRSEMLMTLNCGIGLVLVVDSNQQNWFEATAQRLNQKIFELGTVRTSECGDARVIY